MGFLLKIAIFGFVAWGIWKTANRWFDLLGGNRPVAKAPPPPPPAQAPVQPPVQPAVQPTVQPRPRVIEDTVPCPVCGAYVAAGAAKCGRPDCPQS